MTNLQIILINFPNMATIVLNPTVDDVSIREHTGGHVDTSGGPSPLSMCYLSSWGVFPVFALCLCTEATLPVLKADLMCQDQD